MSRAAAARIVLFAALAGACLLAFVYRERFDAAALEAWVAGAGAAGPLAYIAVYALATVLLVPGGLLTLAGGALFGPLWGTLYSLSGATLGATGAFLVARYLASDWVARKASGRLRQLIDGVAEEGWRFVALVRLVPLIPFNLLNYALGLTRIGLPAYVVASFVFMLPGGFAYTWLGYAGREAVAGGEGAIRKVLIALALVAAAAFLPRLVKRLRNRPYLTLTSAQLRERLARQDDLAVLDVRPAKDFLGEPGHVPGSINIPLDELPARLAELDSYRARPLAVICRTNRRSAKAVDQLRAAGFSQALIVEDGMLGWLKQGRDAL